MNHYNADNEDQHFMATCALGWKTAESPYEAIEGVRKAFLKGLKKEARYIALFHVPVAPDAKYAIRWFTPQVEGTTKVWEGLI